MDRTYIGMLERGERQPTIAVSGRIADALGMPLPKMIIEAEQTVGGRT